MNLSSNYLDFNIPMSAGGENGIFEFDRFRLDSHVLMLYRDGADLALPPKVVRTLLVLVQNAGAIVSKDDLITEVWSDSIVEESNLSKCLYQLRKTLGNRPNGEPYIQTFRRRGYRFNGEAHLVPNGSAPDRRQAGAEMPHRISTVERHGNVLRVVEWSPASNAEPLIETVPQPATISTKPSSLTILLAALALVAVAGGGLLGYLWQGNAPAATIADRQREITVTRLTNGNFVWGATISPDGSYFAYSEIDADESRLFVQQTGQNSRVELVSMPDHTIQGTAFSPDGRWIYFLGTKRGDLKGTLFRIPTIGGSPTSLLSGSISTVSFSPDGQEIAFMRVNAQHDTSLMIADKEGRGERAIVERRGLVTIGSNGAWSPDGTKIVFSEWDRTKSPGTSRLKMVDMSTGIVSSYSDESWDVNSRTEWLPDGSGIATIGTRAVDRAMPIYHHNVYFVSYPEGVSRRITNDGNRHDLTGLGIARDGSLIAVPVTRTCQIWSMKATGDAASAVQVTRGSADGRAGLVPLPDGRIAYTARTAESLTLWVANDDGSDAKQIATGFDYNEELRADPAGRFLVFSSITKDSAHHLFRVNPDGSDLRQLTFGNTYEIDSAVSPDGKTIVTHSENLSANPTTTVLKKIPADGGEPQVLAIENCISPVFSPDGSMLSCVRNGAEAVIVTASDGREIEKLPFPPGAVANFGAVWTPDAAGLIVMTPEGGTNNLTVLPRDRSKPYKLTNFTSGSIFRFAFSHDGRRLFVARGYPTQDAILIKNFK
ncbi:MAG TPA: winged helix-turn-helix domain-containing protein [Pyrinomonadaceae bacterium]|nr:winged helix-turn-helix domain-containing protein [Pyrinomonadaceae bacterium]